MAEAEPMDAMAPWTIKAVAGRTRLKIIAAARREGVTVGQWLEKRVEEWEADGGPVPLSGASAPAGLPSGLGDLAGFIQATRELAETAGVAVPPQLARDAITTARKAMRMARGLPAAPGRRGKALRAIAATGA